MKRTAWHIVLGCFLAMSASAGLVSLAQQPPQPAADGRLAEAARALSAGDEERALRLATEHLKRNPESASARVLAARVHIAREDFDAAYEQLRRAVRSHPRNVDALYYLGLVSGRLAATEMERLSRIAPESARVHQLQAEALEAQGRRPAAEAEYEAALRVKPDLLDALLGLGKLKRVRLACDEAIGLYEKAEAIRPTFDGAYGLGVCYSYEQEDERALARFREAVARDPRAAVAWVGLGGALMKLGRPAEAIAPIERAIALEPRMSEAYYALGRAYQKAGDPARSEQAFAKARELQTAVQQSPERQ